MIKLPDFTNDSHFNRLRAAMGAPFVVWRAPGAVLDAKTKKALLDGTQYYDDPTDIPTDDDGFFQVQGYRVVAYIRDQFSHYDQPGESKYKYHLTDCGTLSTMRRTGKFDRRYVTCNRDDGTFLVNKIQYGQLISRDEPVRMYLCRNCWNILRNLGLTDQLGRQYEKFNLKQYFDLFGAAMISELPLHTAKTAPVNEYSNLQADLSRVIREKNGWKCANCETDFSERHQYLQMHHMDGNKANNTPDNLVPLCIVCHSKQRGHSHLMNAPLYAECLKFIERKQYSRLGR